MISCLSTKECRRHLRKCRVCRTKRNNANKDAFKCNGDKERIRDEIAEREVQLQELVHKSHRIYPTEVELDEEIQNVHAGRERRHGCASQSNACCFDPTVVEQLFPSGSGTSMAADPSLSRGV